MLLFFSISNAEIKTITATHTYKMGDNDSRNEARRICFIEAKRSVLEQAGTYMQSSSEVRNYQLSKDEIITYSAALLAVETVNEKWEDASITITVRAVVDTGHIDKQLSEIKKSASLQKQIIAQQEKIQELEKAVTSMQKQLNSVDVIQATPLRKERNVIIKQIDDLQARYIEIAVRVEQRSKDAKKYVTRGMSKKDVQSLLGEPDGISGDWWYYGKTFINFHSGGLVWRVGDE